MPSVDATGSSQPDTDYSNEVCAPDAPTEPNPIPTESEPASAEPKDSIEEHPESGLECNAGFGAGDTWATNDATRRTFEDEQDPAFAELELKKGEGALNTLWKAGDEKNGASVALGYGAYSVTAGAARDAEGNFKIEGGVSSKISMAHAEAHGQTQFGDGSSGSQVSGKVTGDVGTIEAAAKIGASVGPEGVEEQMDLRGGAFLGEVSAEAKFAFRLGGHDLGDIDGTASAGYGAAVRAQLDGKVQEGFVGGETALGAALGGGVTGKVKVDANVRGIAEAAADGTLAGAPAEVNASAAAFTGQFASDQAAMWDGASKYVGDHGLAGIAQRLHANADDCREIGSGLQSVAGALDAEAQSEAQLGAAAMKGLKKIASE